VPLRETKASWIAHDGSKWSKRNGYPMEGRKMLRWPMYRLDLSTVQPITQAAT
jgi:hypothetical protein